MFHSIAIQSAVSFILSHALIFIFSSFSLNSPTYKSVFYTYVIRLQNSNCSQNDIFNFLLPLSFPSSIDKLCNVGKIKEMETLAHIQLLCCVCVCVCVDTTKENDNLNWIWIKSMARRNTNLHICT